MTLFMNTALAEYAERLVKLKNQDKKTFKLVLDNNFVKQLVIDLNTKKQLSEQSVDSLNRELFNTLTGRTVYAPSDPLGRGGRPYQILRTGAFYDSFVVAVNAGNIKIVSNPFKRNTNLFEVYGAEIEGLTEESLQTLINEAITLYIQWYERNLLPQ